MSSNYGEVGPCCRLTVQVLHSGHWTWFVTRVLVLKYQHCRNPPRCILYDCICVRVCVCENVVQKHLDHEQGVSFI